MLPCSTPTAPAPSEAPCLPVAIPSAARLDADDAHAAVGDERRRRGRSRWSRRRRRRRSASGSRPVASGICARASRPITALEVAHHHRIRDAGRATEPSSSSVSRTLVTQSRSASLIGVLERAASRLSTGITRRAEQLHAEDVERLALDVHARPCRPRTRRPRSAAGGGGGDAVLARAGLGDDARACPCAARAAPGRARC